MGPGLVNLKGFTDKPRIPYRVPGGDHSQKAGAKFKGHIIDRFGQPLPRGLPDPAARGVTKRVTRFEKFQKFGPGLLTIGLYLAYM
jgi:hypothetical protein